MRKDVARYLLVSPKNKTSEWVLPKGHIKDGENPQAAASREVLEETGVRTRPIRPLLCVEFESQNENIKAQFFLMERISEDTTRESRKLGWFPLEQALRLATHVETKELLQVAEAGRSTL